MPQLSHQNPLADFVGSVHLGRMQSHKQLSLWPLLTRAGGDGLRGFVPLAEALAAGTVAVDEVDRFGSVPHVRISNRGKLDVLVLFGEAIVGAKQNRIANASFLVPAGEEVVIDVSCVEQGRWSRGPRARGAAREGRSGFASGDHVSSSALRRLMAAKVAVSRERGGGFDADQAEVWDGVRARLYRSGTRSASHDYSDYVETRRRDLDELRGAFHTEPGQVGFVAAIGSAVEGLEAVGDPAVFESVFPRLLEAYAIDAIDQALLDRPEARPVFDAPETFLEAVAGSPVRAGASLGHGTDLRLGGGSVGGCALWSEGMVHLMAFPLEPEAAGDSRSDERLNEDPRLDRSRWLRRLRTRGTAGAEGRASGSSEGSDGGHEGAA